MFKIRYAVLAAIAALGITATFTGRSAEADGHAGKTVSILHSPDNRPCTFFQLTGVTQADPVVPNVAYFALPKSAVGYNEMLSMLLLSRAKGLPLSVYTDGTTSCGHATVRAIIL